jgi:adenylate cyclase
MRCSRLHRVKLPMSEKKHERITRWLRRRRAALGIGFALALLGNALVAADPWGRIDQWRELSFDFLSTTFPRLARSSAVSVIDIDRATLEAIGSWPWPRDTLARLIEGAAKTKPKVLALDMLLTDDQKPRKPPDRAGDERPGDLRLDDARLAAALERVPSVLGIVLDPEGGSTHVEGPPIVIASGAKAPELMQAAGLDAPSDRLRRAGKGAGIISLGSPEGGLPVRSVPLLAAAGASLQDGLAVEALRIAQGEVTLIANAKQVLIIGSLFAPLADDAALRLRPTAREHRTKRTISALTLFGEGAESILPAGQILLIGASAPEAGGLRRTAADGFMPSVQIQADAVEQILDGSFVTRPSGTALREQLVTFLMAALAILASAGLSPFWAISVVGAMMICWIATSLTFFLQDSILVDPLIPIVVTAISFQGAALAHSAVIWRERRAIINRFSQHLAPEVVRRIAQNPEILRLEGEERIVTSLFTDIEGFTALIERTPPREFIALINRYIDCVTSIVIEHGGMVDKVVGDAVHALFNAPLDLDDHARRAIDCATAVLAATMRLQQSAEGTRHQLGRTRIGIETGVATVGDFGGKRKLDYTAHGPAVNTSAKLEMANKLFGSSISVGPGAVGACAGLAFRPLGYVKPSMESEPILACEPWPAADPTDLAAYVTAFELFQRDPPTAATAFEALARRFNGDAVLTTWAARLDPERDGRARSAHESL